ncbi:MAG: lysophospholipid acyltransferase family protein [Luteibaculum sp.]
MNGVGFGILKLAGRLPFFIFHGLSNLLFPVLYYFLAYRKDVVLQNLGNSFPEKSPNEIKAIAKNFYKHLADIFLEYIKLLGINGRELKSRLHFHNEDVLLDLQKKNRNIILVMGHYGNWEFLLGLPFFNEQFNTNIAFKSLYKVQKNKRVDSILYKSRSKHGMGLIPAQDVKQEFANPGPQNQAVIFLADQSPSNSRRAHWTKFLNQDTGILMGTERYAQLFNHAVVYLKMTRLKRGEYEVSFELIAEHPKEWEKGKISEKHHQLLERDIKEAPQYWLWTHKRWKKQKPMDL